MLGVMVDSCVDRKNTDDLSCVKSVRIYLRKWNVIFKHAKTCTSNRIIMWQYCQFDKTTVDMMFPDALPQKLEDCLNRSQMAFCFTLMTVIVEAEWNLFLIVVRMMPRWHEPITVCEILHFLTSFLLHLKDRFVSADWFKKKIQWFSLLFGTELDWMSPRCLAKTIYKYL